MSWCRIRFGPLYCRCWIREKKLIGYVTRNSPFSDHMIGYQGPTDVLIVLDPEKTVIGLAIRSSYDNEPYVGYLTEDEYFLNTFVGFELSEIAQIDMVEAGIDCGFRCDQNRDHCGGEPDSRRKGTDETGRGRISVEKAKSISGGSGCRNDCGCFVRDVDWFDAIERKALAAVGVSGVAGWLPWLHQCGHGFAGFAGGVGPERSCVEGSSGPGVPEFCGLIGSDFLEATDLLHSPVSLRRGAGLAGASGSVETWAEGVARQIVEFPAGVVACLGGGGGHAAPAIQSGCD